MAVFSAVTWVLQRRRYVEKCAAKYAVALAQILPLYLIYVRFKDLGYNIWRCWIVLRIIGGRIGSCLLSVILSRLRKWASPLTETGKMFSRCQMWIEVTQMSSKDLGAVS